MPTIDGFYTSSTTVLGDVDSMGVSPSNYVTPKAEGGYTSSNVDPNVPKDVVLLSAAPDPVMMGNTLVITGLNLEMVLALYVGGVSTPWNYVSTTQINVLISNPLTGLKEIYAEFV